MKKIFIHFLFSFAIISSLNAQWKQCNNGLGCSNIWPLASNENIIYTGTDGCGVLLSTNNGDNWIAKNNGINVHHFLDIPAIAINGSNIFASTIKDGIFRSIDNGENWEQKSKGLLNWNNGHDTFYIEIVYAIIIKGNNIFAGTQRGMFVSTNNGDNWTMKNNGLPIIDSTYLNIQSLAISGNNIFAGSTRYGVSKSTDNGDNWVLINNGLTNLVVRSLVINGKNIFAGTNGGLFLSTDNGDNWNITGFNDTVINAIIIKENNIFVYANAIYLSTDYGDSWSAHNSGLPNYVIGSFIINGNYIFAATHGDGVYRAKLSDFGITDVKETKQLNEILISPNPTSDFLDLTFTPELSQFKIEIFSIEGIKMFETEPMKRIDVRRLVPGVYFVKLGSRVEKFVKM